MSEPNDQQFDAILSGFFQETLDPHCGRSERAFRRFLGETGRTVWRQRTWLLGAFVTGMAASVAMLWAVPFFRGPAPAKPAIVADNGAPTIQSPARQVQRVVQSHTTDEGIVLFGNDTPVHVLRRQQLQQTRWLNGQQKIQAEQSTPQDELLFIKVPTY